MVIMTMKATHRLPASSTVSWYFTHLETKYFTYIETKYFFTLSKIFHFKQHISFPRWDDSEDDGAWWWRTYRATSFHSFTPSRYSVNSSSSVNTGGASSTSPWPWSSRRLWWPWGWSWGWPWGRSWSSWRSTQQLKLSIRKTIAIVKCLWRDEESSLKMLYNENIRIAFCKVSQWTIVFFL